MYEPVTLVPINHLSEVAGVKRALKEYDRNPYLQRRGVPRYLGTVRRLEEQRFYMKLNGEPCGDYLGSFDRSFYLELPWFCTEEERQVIRDALFEDVREDAIDEAGSEWNALENSAYAGVVADLEKEVQRVREENPIDASELERLWPRIADLLLKCGPLSTYDMDCLPGLELCRTKPVIKELVWQGRLVICGEDEFLVELSPTALDELGITECPKPLEDDERLVYLLREFSPVGATPLVSVMDGRDSAVRKRLGELVAEGKVIREKHGRGKGYTYQLADGSLGSNESQVA